MWGISRLALDPFLLQAARASGAKVLQPARLEHDLRIRDLQTNQVESLSADYVLAGDGKAPRRTEDLGLKAHFRNVDAPGDTIALFGVRGHYGGIAPIEGGRWNVAFSVPVARISQFVTRASRPCEHSTHGRDAHVTNDNLDRLLGALECENAALKVQMRSAERVSDWLVSPLPRFSVQRRWPDGMIPIGNAAAAIEPIGGEGMGLAMRSAELAAQCLIEAIRRGVEPDLQRLRREYRSLWTVRGLACRLAGLAVSSPWLCRMILPFVDGEDALTGVALRALGKA
jgi:flavin-dependent dehydrogenase